MEDIETMKKRLAVMAASALLAVAPIATVTTSIATTQTVSAAEMSPSQLMHNHMMAITL